MIDTSSRRDAGSAGAGFRTAWDPAAGGRLLGESFSARLLPQVFELCATTQSKRCPSHSQRPNGNRRTRIRFSSTTIMLPSLKGPSITGIALTTIAIELRDVWV